MVCPPRLLRHWGGLPSPIWGQCALRVDTDDRHHNLLRAVVAELAPDFRNQQEAIPGSQLGLSPRQQDLWRRGIRSDLTHGPGHEDIVGEIA